MATRRWPQQLTPGGVWRAGVSSRILPNVHYCLVTVSIWMFSTPARVPTYISMTITVFLYMGTWINIRRVTTSLKLLGTTWKAAKTKYRVSQKMYICFVYSFYRFQHSQLRPISKDSQFHGDLLTLPMDSVASSWLSLWHVLEVSVFLGHTALLCVWPPRPNIRLGKSRKWPQGSPVSKFPMFLVPPGA